MLSVAIDTAAITSNGMNPMSYFVFPPATAMPTTTTTQPSVASTDKFKARRLGAITNNHQPNTTSVPHHTLTKFRVYAPNWIILSAKDELVRRESKRYSSHMDGDNESDAQLAVSKPTTI